MCPGPYAKLAEQAERYDEIAEQSSSRLRTHHSDEVEKLRQQARDALLQEAQSGKLLEVLHQARHSQPMSLISFGSRPRGVVVGSASWQTVGNTSPKLRAATNQKLNSQTRWCSLGSKPEKLSAGRAVWQIVRGVTSEF